MAAVALAGAGCVADDPDPNAATISSGGAVEISMSEFAYLPSVLTLVAGSTVTITLINDGVVAHEFMAGQTRAEGGGYDQDLLVQVLEDADGSRFSTAGVTLGRDDHAHDAVADEHAEGAMTDEEMAAMDGGGHAHAGAAITVEPGGRVTLKVHIPDDAVGTWELGCFIEGHYEAGMHGTITIPISDHLTSSPPRNRRPPSVVKFDER